MKKFEKEILEQIKNCFREEDFSHNFNHTQRVYDLAVHIAKIEGGDLDTIKAATLLHDIARLSEDVGECGCHAEEGAKRAKLILKKINFPKEKIDNVCHAVAAHRKSKGLMAQTLEAKILQDSDRLDSIGAINIPRVIVNSVISQKYKRPIYIDEPYQGEQDVNKSAIHYLIFKSKMKALQPKSFYTKTAQEMAKGRFEFMNDFIKRFISEWRGEL